MIELCKDYLMTQTDFDFVESLSKYKSLNVLKWWRHETYYWIVRLESSWWCKFELIWLKRLRVITFWSDFRRCLDMLISYAKNVIGNNFAAIYSI